MQRPPRQDRWITSRHWTVAPLCALVAVFLPLGSIAGQQAGDAETGVDAAALAEAAPGEWLTYGRDQAETHYSPLDQIDSDNVDRLEVAWSWEIPVTGISQLQASPNRPTLPEVI